MNMMKNFRINMEHRREDYGPSGLLNQDISKRLHDPETGLFAQKDHLKKLLDEKEEEFKKEFPYGQRPTDPVDADTYDHKAIEIKELKDDLETKSLEIKQLLGQQVVKKENNKTPEISSLRELED